MKKEADEKEIVWHNAQNLTIEGKGWEDTESFYHRLPAKAKGIVSAAVWRLSKSPSGMSIKFTTNSPSLAVRWDGFKALSHMPAIGVSGLDLYVKHKGRWRWLEVGRPFKKVNQKQLFKDLPAEKRDYTLYLPLYNTVKKVEIGIPRPFKLQAVAPSEKKPVVFYGTSITMGACASRPGMCYTSILARRLDNPAINLGFSNNGRMEPKVIDLLCELDPAVYVLDCMPNMSLAQIEERLEAAVIKLRKARPKTPVMLIDNMLYPNAFLKSEKMSRYNSRNNAQYSIYKKLLDKGITHLHYVKDNAFLGTDGEATVDGTHFTDLGHLRFSEKLLPTLQKIISTAHAAK